MADNVQITQGSGTNIATDDVSNVQYQIVKLADGTDGSGTPVAVGAGTSANALRVINASDGGTIGVRFSDQPLVVAQGVEGSTERSLRMNTDGAIKVYDLAAGTVTVGTGSTGTLGIHLLSTGGTLAVKIDTASGPVGRDDSQFTANVSFGIPAMGLFDDTATDSVDEGDIGVFRMSGNRIQMAHLDTTASLFTVSGSTSGISTSGVTIIAPSASYNFKIHAFSIQTTGLVSLVTKFTNGSGGSPVEFFRPLITEAATAARSVGANMVSMPSAPIFATGTATTLALVLDTATLVHYSVSYTKESS